VENIVLGFVLGASIIGFLALLMMTIRLSFIISEMATIIKSIYVSINKIEQMSQATMQASENFVDALSEVTKEESTFLEHPRTFKLFRTEDGKHSSTTVDGLIEKMRKDPKYREITNDDIDEIRKLFEDNTEDDDDDQPNEPWK
jgi:hypothetical protein